MNRIQPKENPFKGAPERNMDRSICWLLSPSSRLARPTQSPVTQNGNYSAGGSWLSKAKESWGRASHYPSSQPRSTLLFMTFCPPARGDPIGSATSQRTQRFWGNILQKASSSLSSDHSPLPLGPRACPSQGLSSIPSLPFHSHCHHQIGPCSLLTFWDNLLAGIPTSNLHVDEISKLPST